MFQKFLNKIQLITPTILVYPCHQVAGSSTRGGNSLDSKYFPSPGGRGKGRGNRQPRWAALRKPGMQFAVRRVGHCADRNRRAGHLCAFGAFTHYGFTPISRRYRDLRQLWGRLRPHPVGATSPSTLPLDSPRSLEALERLRTLRLSKGRSRYDRPAGGASITSHKLCVVFWQFNTCEN